MEDHSLRICDRLVHVRAEEQVPAPGGLDDLIKSGLVDGEVVRVPSVNPGLVQVDDGDLDVRAGRGISVGYQGRRGFRFTI